MSFPNRTACYNQKNDEIIYPEDEPHFYTSPIGAVDTPYSGLDRHLIPLASTGLEDSEDREGFEGHLAEYNGEIYVIKWWENVGAFGLTFWTDRGQSDFYDMSMLGLSEIAGHALTDPEMVPDSFDVEGYFELHD